MLVHADGHSPSGHLPLMDIQCCPSCTEHVCKMGFSYFAIRSGYTVCRMAVILTFTMIFLIILAAKVQKYIHISKQLAPFLWFCVKIYEKRSKL
jgi:hypothetical protein